MNQRVNNRQLSLVAILLGALLAGPVANYVVAALCAFVVSVSAGLAFHLPQPAALIEGSVAGVIGGVICGKTQCEPRPAAIGTARMTLVFWTIMVLLRDAVLVPTVTGHFPWVSLLGVLWKVVWVVRYGLAGALAAYLTAVLTLVWNEQRAQRMTAPPRRRPERYVL